MSSHELARLSRSFCGQPIEGTNLASQPMLSRFENAVGLKELYRLSETLAASVLRRHGKRLRGRFRRPTLDLDPTDEAHPWRATIALLQRAVRRLVLSSGEHRVALDDCPGRPPSGRHFGCTLLIAFFNADCVCASSVSSSRIRC
jgi:hypothetical protein